MISLIIPAVIGYPLYLKTQWNSNSLSPATALGWSLSGELNLQIQFEGSPPDMQIITRMTRTKPTPWVPLGFYQTYLQFLQPEISAQQSINGTLSPYYNNYVCSIRYSA